MENLNRFVYNYIERYYDQKPIYPIEAKYLEKIGHGGYYTQIVLYYARHPEYIEKDKRNEENKKNRIQKVYENAHKWLMFSVENNHFQLKDKPPIAVKPIMDNMINIPFYPEHVLNCKGVYFLYRNKELLYIGSSKNIYSRIKSHYWKNKIPFNCFKFFLMKDEYTMFDVIDFEYLWINDLLPPYNKRLKR